MQMIYLHVGTDKTRLNKYSRAGIHSRFFIFIDPIFAWQPLFPVTAIVESGFLKLGGIPSRCICSRYS